MIQLTTEQAAEYLLERGRFLIITHKNPDGDTLGSAAALCSALRDMGKDAYVLRNAQTTSLYLPYAEPYFIDYSALEGEYTLISVDTADVGLMQLEYEGWTIALAIDHHPTHSQFAENLLLKPGKASCGEVVLDVLKAMNAPVSAETAKLLYIAVSTDTGCFKYKNTNAETLAAAAELVRLGAPNGDLNHRLFTVKRLSRLKLEGMIIESLELHYGGELTICSITREMLDKCGADMADLEDIATVAGQLDGVEMSVTIREQRDGNSKISVRTVNYANANVLCALLGGGGHGMAAGATFEANIAETKERLLGAVANVWKKDEYKI